MSFTFKLIRQSLQLIVLQAQKSTPSALQPTLCNQQNTVCACGSSASSCMLISFIFISSRLPCDKRCTQRLTCGHRCPGLCGEECPSAKFCVEAVCKNKAPDSVKNMVRAGTCVRETGSCEVVAGRKGCHMRTVMAPFRLIVRRMGPNYLPVQS